MNRPQFLTFLCICTLIASSFSLFNGISSYLRPEIITDQYGIVYEKLEDMFSETVKNEQENEAVQSNLKSFVINNTLENNKKTALSKILENILAILAAVAMWGLNKKGYFVYLASGIVAIIAPIFIFNAPMSIYMALGAFVINLIFALIYYSQFKYLK